MSWGSPGAAASSGRGKTCRKDCLDTDMLLGVGWFAGDQRLQSATNNCTVSRHPVDENYHLFEAPCIASPYGGSCPVQHCI
eukprot:scaffold275645_cov24-Tisochrysis_lutea.AAC.1